MKKQYLRNKDGKVRNCTKNIAQMNMFEYCWYFVTSFRGLQEMWYTLVQSFKEFIEGLTFIWNLFWIILLPVYIILKSILTIRKAKKEMKIQ